MNKKSIIQLVIVTICFAGSGMVLYFGYFKGSSSSSSTVSTTLGAVNTEATEKILPYGNSLDFDKVIRKKDFQYQVMTYPVLNAAAEVGIPANELIKPQE